MTTALTTREKLLEEGRVLVQTKSYAGLAFDELAERVGIRKASIYHHFPDKETFGVEVIRQTRERLEDFFAQLSGLPGRTRLIRYFEAMGEGIGAGLRLCPGLAMAANWEALPRSIQIEVHGLAEAHVGAIASFVVAGNADRTLRFQDDPQSVAELAFSTLQGALVLARSRSDATIYAVVTGRFVKNLEA